MVEVVVWLMVMVVHLLEEVVDNNSMGYTYNNLNIVLVRQLVWFGNKIGWQQLMQ